jgi:thioredoxin 1
MKKNRKWWIGGGVAVFAGLIFFAMMESNVASPPPVDIARPERSALPPSPGNGRVTMIDLGATDCIPCKMMAPILKELKAEYAGKAEIGFIDVWKDPAQAQKYGVQAIPTQIFFDKNGREVFRHTGFLDKQAIVEILTRLGVS